MLIQDYGQPAAQVAIQLVSILAEGLLRAEARGTSCLPAGLPSHWISACKVIACQCVCRRCCGQIAEITALHVCSCPDVAQTVAEVQQALAELQQQKESAEAVLREELKQVSNEKQVGRHMWRLGLSKWGLSILELQRVGAPAAGGWCIFLRSSASAPSEYLWSQSRDMVARSGPGVLKECACSQRAPNHNPAIAQVPAPSFITMAPVQSTCAQLPIKRMTSLWTVFTSPPPLPLPTVPQRPAQAGVNIHS